MLFMSSAKALTHFKPRSVLDVHMHLQPLTTYLEQNFTSGVPHTFTDKMQGYTKKCSSWCNRETLKSSALGNAVLLTVIDCFGLEGTIKITPTPCHGQGHLPLNWVAQRNEPHSANKRLFEIKMLNQGTGKNIFTLFDCCV